MKASDFASKLGQSLKSFVKIAVGARSTSLESARRHGPLIIMANGPSLNETIAAHTDTLRAHDTMSVNFAPLTTVFGELKPRYHILADPLFFGVGEHANVPRLYEALSTVDWPLTLIVPRKFRHSLPPTVTDNSFINVATFNFVGAEGFDWVENAAYKLRLAMPRPRNVLIPAIMCGIWLGYNDIYITGADHSWMQTISVDDDNNVISIQPHFYKEDDREQRRVDTTYRGYRLHDIVQSFAVAFRSYHNIRRYASVRGIRIVNATPGSFIDAFPRGPLPSADDRQRKQVSSPKSS